MTDSRRTITRSRRGDLWIFGILLVVIIATGSTRLRVYFRAPPPTVEAPR